MSKQYPGGIISKTPVTPGGSYANSTAPGVWTLEQQAYWQKLGQWPTQGNYNPNAFIENLFSVYLTTGAGATVNVVNGIDLSTYGGLVWQKGRNGSATSHTLFDTARGINNGLFTNSTSAQSSSSNWFTAFNSNGFSFGTDNNLASSGQTGVNWTFREQAKFFDVVTWTGDGLNNRWIDHSLASTPGAIIIKRTDTTSNWVFYHRSLFGYGLFLNTTAAETSANSDNGYVSSTSATQFRVSYGAVNASNVNASGGTYVAYLFAHNAGGFGLTGTDNVISCGSFTGTGSTVSVDLGYEPQWLMFKRTDSTGDWVIIDNMRGWTTGGTDAYLKPNTSDAETNPTGAPALNATGFSWNPASGATFIYIAIRRGPMKVPTSGTSVFSPQTWTGNNTAGRNISTGFPVDLSLWQMRTSPTTINGNLWFDRLRGLSSTSSGTSYYLRSYNTDQESSTADYGYAATMDGFNLGTQAGNVNGSDQYNSNLTSPAPTSVSWNMRRAPSFFDEVCYTGTGSARTVTHNLGVAPEMMIVKVRDSATNWAVYSAAVGNNYYAILNLPDAPYTSSAAWNNTTPTSSVFTVGTNVITNGNGYLYVAYLFASCPGVSKVGSYTGTGTTLQVDCGFTGGARFVMIKRTDSTGDWYVWDSARGIVSGNDPYLLLNSTAAEVTNTDYVDTYSAGFEISSTAPAAINASGGTFIFLAIA